jgi:polyferredoxin
MAPVPAVSMVVHPLEGDRMRHDLRAGIKRSFGEILLVSILVIAFSALLWAEEVEARRSLGFWQVLAFSRHWMSLIFGLLGFFLLWRVRFSRNLRLATLPVIFFVFSVVAVLPLGTFSQRMDLHPSPVCTVAKPLLFIVAGRTVPAVFGVSLIVVAVLTILGNKLFCGWVCPIGAVQELVHRIPLPKGLKRKIPFKVTNAIRILIFAFFVLFAFSMSIEIYAYFNPFEALHWSFGAAGLVTLGVVMFAALFVWRPFCYLVCPLGLVTWLLEQFSVYRIRLVGGFCTDCNRCIDESPCLAMPAIVKQKRIRPDCFACGLCLESCAKKGIGYGRR